MAVELLAPAGSVEALRAACIAGADAVYIGGNRYGARAYADNPDDQDLLEAIRLMHRLGKKLYLTVNTLLKDEEIGEVCAWMRPYYEEGVDAVIVQDLGVVQLFRDEFPDLSIHASTQMAVTGPDGVRLLQGLGIARFVPARELSLSELKAIHEETGAELETFIHGALCYSYSGQCLMSSMIGGRSGNRGRCAGICRLPYKTEAGKNSGGAELYPLNMKDLCTLHLIPQLIEAGISSFKIEGRMKKPVYTAGVVSVYRRAIDAFLKGKWDTYDQQEDLRLLTALYNRDGFTSGYYTQHNGASMIALKNEKLQGKRASSAQKAADKIQETLTGPAAESALQMPVQGSIHLHAGKPAECTLTADLKKPGRNGENSISVCVYSETTVDTARTAPSTEEQIRMQFLKTRGSPFRIESLRTEMDKNVFLSVRMLKELRRNALKKLDSAVLNEYRHHADIHSSGKTEKESCQTDKMQSRTEDISRAELQPKLYVSVLTAEQAEAVLSADREHTLYALCIPPDLAGLGQRLKKRGIRVVLELPYVFRRENPYSAEKAEKMLTETSWDGVMIRTLEEAGMYVRLRKTGRTVPENVMLDATMYTMNQKAAEVFGKWGFAVRTLPYELNFRELRKQTTADTQLVLYGRTPVMISAQCLRKTMGKCTGNAGWTGMTDRTGRRFPVYCSCTDCCNIIYNSVPTSLLQEKDAIRHLQCGSLRLDFTDESPEQIKRILDYAEAVFGNACKKNMVKPELQATKGHFRRGVE